MKATDRERSSQSNAAGCLRVILPLDACDDPALAGGKAAGLCRLLQHGFRVPTGICLTTEAYREALRGAGFDPEEHWQHARRDRAGRSRILAECGSRIASLSLPEQLREALLFALDTQPASSAPLWAVRSSATVEDTPLGSYAGLYTTVLGVPSRDLAGAVTRCWASLWTEAAFDYHVRLDPQDAAPGMAVVIQPMLAPRAAGVAFSSHPVTGRHDHVLINAVWGLAEPLVGGRILPDEYVVHVAGPSDATHLVECTVVHKPTRMGVGANGPMIEAVDEGKQDVPVLPDEDILRLADLVTDVARALGNPVDVEWALDGTRYWLLQARPVHARPSEPILTDQTSVWSRANFKETLPELPSPLALSLTHEYMEACILRHYRELGCRIPPGISSVRTLDGRPYINVTLFQSLVAQLGGNAALVVEQMGGDASMPPPPARRLPWWRLLAAGLQLQSRIRRAVRGAAAWFAEMRGLAHQLTEASGPSASPEAILERLFEIGQRLHRGDLTFGIVSDVAQGLMALQWLLERGIGSSWRPLFNASLQGLGTVISARQILLVQRLADLARADSAATAFFQSDPFLPDGVRIRLRGSRFLEAFDAYLQEFGHRAVGESDMMVPRFSEQPGYLLEIVRGHVLSPPRQSAAEVQARQQAGRDEALCQIRRRLLWRPVLWTAVRWWHRRLARALALREENRHQLMYLCAAIRRAERRVGDGLAAAGRLAAADDIFFLTAGELRTITEQSPRDYRTLVAARRREREAWAAIIAPDVSIPGGRPGPGVCEEAATLHGTPISAGVAEGTVRLVMGPVDAGRVVRGDILVMPVIDPGMTPLLGLAGGLIVEMGGTLSHGAIIAREYGLPAIVNVPAATRRLRDGEWVVVDATRGDIRRVPPAS